MSADRLTGVHPTLIAKVQRISSAMAEIGYPMMVTDGVRTDAEQIMLFQKGRSIDGKVIHPSQVVTHCDGIHKRSNHQTRDGLGRAVDMCFIVDGKPSWDDDLPWKLYGLMAETLGLRWGGRWTHPVDRPHIEMELPK